MNAVFKILIAHESLQRGIRAHEMVTRLRAQIPEELAMECEAWKFDWLARPQLRARAASAASSADMIIISAHSAVDLPAHVKTWIQDWLPNRKSGTAALVAMFDGQEPSSQSALLHANLLQMAMEGSMDFFWKNEAPGGPELHGPNPSYPPAEALTFDGAPEQRVAPRGWGINE